MARTGLFETIRKRNLPTLSLKTFGWFACVFSVLSCATLPEPDHKTFEFPEGKAFMDKLPSRPYKTVGEVKSKVNYSTMGIEDDANVLCKNYFNKAVKKLVEYAEKRGADAVIDVQSVVVLLDGKIETYPRAECYEDGAEGQVLARGIAIKWSKTQ